MHTLRARRAQREARRKKEAILTPDAKIQEACKGLLEHTHSQGAALVLIGETFKERPKGTIYTTKIDGVEIGYRRTAYSTFMRREIFIKVPGYRLEDISESERGAIMTAIFNVFLIPGAAIPEIKAIAPNCMVITQDFVPMIPVERSPGLVSIAGGLG